MVAWFGVARMCRPQCEDRTPARVDQQACGCDLEPILRRRSPYGDHDLLGTVVPHRDPSRGRRSNCQACRRDGERNWKAIGACPLRGRGRPEQERWEDCERQDQSHRATAVNVTFDV
jgi:hypothetical protein